MTRKAVLRVLFAVYLILLLYFLFFAEWYHRVPADTARFNFIPFYEIRRFLTYRETIGTSGTVLNLAGNVLGFIPLGIMLPVLRPLFARAGRTVLAGLLLSAAVEGLQLALRVGSCDIDDVILNTAGAAAGYLIYHLVKVGRKRGRTR